MPADRIEREIDIDAPIDVVWAVITEPEHINGWFTDAVEVEIRPGSEGRLRWDANDKRRAHTVNLRVERLEPPHFFSFRWEYQRRVRLVGRSEEHTSELQSRQYLVCRLLLV